MVVAYHGQVYLAYVLFEVLGRFITLVISSPNWVYFI
jgi:hypothetical protein